ncbi:uncharacterized protein FTOL_02873 [Fusarium torulosum]|uniref:Uncharacterized protein n=1 Tax=Fusarium torulosum TaxID=33205 RepID=A0AAE8M2W1_9HYPO|nr:uncharacterized protein FTOL_02873 [Fusarium torulosum]
MVSFGAIMDIVSKVLEVGSHLVTVVEKVANMAKSWVKKEIKPKDLEMGELPGVEARLAALEEEVFGARLPSRRVVEVVRRRTGTGLAADA